METMLSMEKKVFRPPELGCVLYLSALPGGGNKIYDRSPYGNHGTIYGATWKFQNGIWVLDFDGADDYVTCGNPASLVITGALTYKAWVYFNSFDGSPGIMGRGWSASSTAAKVASMLYVGSDGKPVFNICDRTTQVNVTADNALSLSTWYMLLAFWDGTTGTDSLQIFVNGVQDGKADSTIASIQTTPAEDNHFKLGMRGVDGSHGDLDGRIALPSVYRGAISLGKYLRIKERFNREKHLFGVW